jgi:tellurite resistance protein TerC
MSDHIWLWVLFNIGVIILLCLDLFVFNRKSHSIQVKEALLWTAVYVVLAALFALGLYFFYHNGLEPSANSAMSFVTGYLIEQSLSVDNLFVIMLIFTFFRTPTAYQHRVLFWGIIGAIFFRVLFIFLGVSLINRFSFTIYILGALLIYTAIKMFFQKDTEIDPEKNFALRLFSKVMPVSKLYEGGNFFTRLNGKWHATPLFIVLLVIETTDIVFALDSIPAIIAITKDPFIVYSSNIFAVLGLRSLYFALAGIMKLFHFLHYGLSVILFYIGVEIIIHKVIPIPIWVSLSVVAGILTISIILSIIFPAKDELPVHHGKE